MKEYNEKFTNLSWLQSCRKNLQEELIPALQIVDYLTVGGINE